MSGRSPPTTPVLFAAAAKKVPFFGIFFGLFQRGKSCFESALGPSGPGSRARKACLSERERTYGPREGPLPVHISQPSLPDWELLSCP